jgi:hypothetical protein
VSYSLYRKTTQLLDLIVLDVNHLAFNSRLLIASAMLLTLGFYYNSALDISGLRENESITQLLKSNSFLNQVFADFVAKSFGISIFDLSFPLAYCSKFHSIIEYDFELPSVTKNSDFSDVFMIKSSVITKTSWLFRHITRTIVIIYLRLYVIDYYNWTSLFEFKSQ